MEWHSNVPELETACENYEPSFAKEQLGVSSSEGECKPLGVTWNKKEYELVLDFPTKPAEQTKGGILAKLAKTYDPLGLASLVMLKGKLVYRETCTEKIS